MRDNTDHIRDNTDIIRSDVQDMHEAVLGLDKALQNLPGQIQQGIIREEKVAHDAYLLGGMQLGTLGLILGLVLGMFIGGAKK